MPPAMHFVRGSRYLAVVALLLLAAACSKSDAPERSIALAECRLPKLATAARCGTVEVPEDRSKPDGRRISLFVAVLPATTLSPKPDPLLILAGGPGQSATSLAAFASRLVEVRRTRDVVLVDQRGTGKSAPLACAAFVPEEKAADALDIDPLPRATRCVADLKDKGIDVAQYTTDAFIADLEAVRKALGVERWNLWGGSYGTRAALEYLRAHEPRVRSIVLDGVAPPTLKISLGVWPTRERSLDALFASCEATPSCASAHPDLKALLTRIRDELGADGKDVDIVDPRTGERETVRLTYAAVLAGLHPLTYVPELAVTLPEILKRGVAGDWSPLFAVAQMVTGDMAEQMNVALHYTVTCTEDTPRIGVDDRALLKDLRSRAIVERVLSVCDVWPKGRLPKHAGQPVTSAVPVLMLSGALDPVTPPSYAEEVAKTLSNAKHVVAGGYGHIVSAHACGPRLIAAFVDRARFTDVPKSCVDYFERSKRPPLWPDHLAPAR
ncbi:MAG TPA: alpha/beta fold hydrolase [Casimicrobiaceae bacterium]|nr:alpha/beta fold hydrolase [Casimicrobiaceae bacterium]